MYSITFITNLLFIKLLFASFYFLTKYLIINNPIVKFKIMLVLKKKKTLFLK